MRASARWICCFNFSILVLSLPTTGVCAPSGQTSSLTSAHSAIDVQLRLTGNWGWLGADLNNNPVQRAFTDDLVEDGKSTWKFGYLVAQLQAQGQLASGDWACVLQLKYQERGTDLFTEQLRDDIELDLGFCAYERETSAGHHIRLAAGEKHFAFGLKPADVPLLDVFPERAGVVYGESIRRRTSGGMMEASFSPNLESQELEVIAYWAYDFLLGFGFQTQDGAVLDEIHAEAYGLQLTWRSGGGLSLSLGAVRPPARAPITSCSASLNRPNSSPPPSGSEVPGRLPGKPSTPMPSTSTKYPDSSTRSTWEATSKSLAAQDDGPSLSGPAMPGPARVAARRTPSASTLASKLTLA